MRHKFQSTFKDGNGRVVGTATTSDGVAGAISVYLAGTTTVASIYTASSGGTAVNSVTTDTHGYFYFWIDEDDYTIPQKFKIVLSHSDFESKTYDNLDILGASAATTSLAGAVELATNAETITGTDAERAVTADGLAYALQRGTMQYVADTAANDTYVATLVPAIDAYVDGMEVRFKAKTANTGACTLNVNGKGAKAIKKHRDQDTVTGDIEAGQIVTVVYDLSNTVWQMQSQLAIPGDVTAAANIDDNSIVVGDGGAKGVKKSVALSAQGDILYASAANVLARLAKGAANTKIFMNAGATAPEWAVGIKFGTFTRDTAIATGTQAITGLGFKPSHVIFLVSTSNTAQVSIGFDSGSLAYCVQNKQGVAADTWGIDITYSILLFQTDVKYYAGKLTALGSDGFTVSWVKEGDKTGTATIFYMAFR